jgi:hypothetical protein
MISGAGPYQDRPARSGSFALRHAPSPSGASPTSHAGGSHAPTGVIRGRLQPIALAPAERRAPIRGRQRPHAVGYSPSPRPSVERPSRGRRARQRLAHGRQASKPLSASPTAGECGAARSSRSCVQASQRPHGEAHEPRPRPAVLVIRPRSSAKARHRSHPHSLCIVLDHTPKAG